MKKLFYGNQHISVYHNGMLTTRIYKRQKTKFIEKVKNTIVFILFMAVVTGGAIGAMYHAASNDLAFNSIAEAHAQEPIDTPQEIVTYVLAHEFNQTDASINQALETIGAESSWDRYAVGDGGKALGLWQIHGDFHQISKECRFDPWCSSRKMAPLWSQGIKTRCELWTEYWKAHKVECQKLGVYKKI